MAAKSRNILVGYDGTDAGRRALDAAADLAGYGSTVSVVAVGTSNGKRFDPDSLLSDARDRLLGRHVLARYFEPAGASAHALVETARQLRASLLVVGRTGDERPRSLSADVGRHAPCDVLIVG